MIRLLAWGAVIRLTPDDARLCRALLYWIGITAALAAFASGLVAA